MLRVIFGKAVSGKVFSLCRKFAAKERIWTKHCTKIVLDILIDNKWFKLLLTQNVFMENELSCVNSLKLLTPFKYNENGRFKLDYYCYIKHLTIKMRL